MKPSFVRIFDSVCTVEDRNKYQRQGKQTNKGLL